MVFIIQIYYKEKVKNTDPYKMKIHDTIDLGSDCVCLRVHDGWLYIFYSPFGDDGSQQIKAVHHVQGGNSISSKPQQVGK